MGTNRIVPMNKYIKKTLKLTFFTGLTASVALFCHKATDGFTINSISHVLEDGSQPLPEDLNFLYNTTFSYLGKGAQAFAFVSSDKKYVIKFIRFDHLLPKPFVRLFQAYNHPYIKLRLARSQREISELLQSFNFAQTHLKQETKVIHFQKKSLDRPLFIIDKIGCAHKIQNAPFIVQHYVPSLGDQIHNLDTENIKIIIDQMFAMARKRHQLGIKDKDPNLLTNFGFCNRTLVEFDIGRFYSTTIYESIDTRRQELIDIFKPFLNEFIEKDSNISSYFEEKLNDL